MAHPAVPRKASPISPASGTVDPLPLPNTGGRVSRHVLIATIAAMAAAWIAAGSTGLLGHGLRHALTWVALAIVIAAGWPDHRHRAIRVAILVAGTALAVIMNASMLPAINVLGVVVLLASVIALRPADGDRAALAATHSAIVIFALYRVACSCIPAFWMLANPVGEWIGAAAALLTGRPLWVGTTMAGMDLLVMSASFYGLWLGHSPKPRASRAAYGAAAFLIAHGLYLTLVSFAPDLLGWLGPAATGDDLKHWSLTEGLRTLIPWNLPAVGAMLHLLVMGFMIRWTTWPSDANTSFSASPKAAFRSTLGMVGGVAVALVLPLLTVLSHRTLDLKGKKIVAYKEGFLNWLKPEHGDYGRLSIGMYGMLPTYVESMGGECVISPDLSSQDLAGADALIFFYPNKPWTEGQLDRIWNFVREGGALLVMGEHTIREDDVPLEKGGNRFNELLEPTGIRVRFDSAQFEVGGWLQSYESIAHPMICGIADDRNQFGVVIGASLDVRWPAVPLLLGRHGYADPGDEGSGAAMMGNHSYDAGERLGDMVLVAEQRFGNGKVVVFGDTSSMTNGITVGSYVFTSRLLGYLADRDSMPQSLTEQFIAILLLAAMLALLVVGNAGAGTLAAVALVLSGSLVFSHRVTHQHATILPDGRLKSPNNLAYVDASHLQLTSEESWRDDGTMGLIMTLMRNGYLTLTLPELTLERIERAAILVVNAPSRPFSRTEQEALQTFVERGGILIWSVGFPEYASSRETLARFGLYVGESPPGPDGTVAEPVPLGHFKSPYVEVGGYRAHVRFHAAWPVSSSDPTARVMAYGHGDVPVILMRTIGSGKVVLIGDSWFAANKNLEREGGEPFEGMRENSDFWRWLIADLTGRTPWYPAKLPTGATIR